MFRQEVIKIQILKCSQILCAHKPYFLTLAHVYILLKVHTNAMQMAKMLKSCIKAQ